MWPTSSSASRKTATCVHVTHHCGCPLSPIPGNSRQRYVCDRVLTVGVAMALMWLVLVQGGLVDLVLDAEIVAVDRSQDNRLLPFQTLSTRARHGRAAGACRDRSIDHAAPGSGGGWMVPPV